MPKAATTTNKANGRVCTECGRVVRVGDVYCPACGKFINDGKHKRPADAEATEVQEPVEVVSPAPVSNGHSRVVAALLAFFLGGFGIHNFYLGFTSRAVIQLLLTLVLSLFTCGASAFAAYVWAFVEGVMILAGADGYTTDASGERLHD